MPGACNQRLRSACTARPAGLSAWMRHAAVALLCCLWSAAWAGIDHKVEQDESGIWNPNIERGLLLGLTIGQVGLAVWEGGESRLGNTAWRGIDSEIIGAVSSEVMKRVFTRVRPSETDDPGQWFAGDSNHSFPSGEAAEAASIVTPYMLEYGRDYPAVYALSLIPLYVGVARVKAQAHWQTDVIGGWAVGGLAGWYAHERDSPLLLQVMPRGIFVGLKKSF
jgi:membrane-associated phospholipid phosphatase